MFHKKGFTLIEMILSILILSIVVIAISTFFSKSLKLTYKLDIKKRAFEVIFPAIIKIEKLIVHANEILEAKSDRITFITDINMWENYNENEDFDEDGLINKYDPDIDNDSTEFSTAEERWKIGYNLKDDDDDNDGKIDMRWKIYVENNTLYLDYSHNEENWGNHKEIILTNLSTENIFSYFGSKDELLSINGVNIDYNGDGIVTQEEMDEAGNNNGELDLKEERDYIVSIRINLSVDINNDGETDYNLNTEILPPMLYLKRRPD
ncbi:MAG: hypothetical protein DRI36_03595 [Caldiserica bacterium]|nr:MAG: hypothetical protein DRI36_03595 [Caldisericota bacterium]